MSNINIRRVKDAVTKEEFYPQTCIEAVVDENGQTLGIDASPTDDSDKLVRSGGVKAAIDGEASARADADSALGTRIDGANIGIQAAMAAVNAEQQRAVQAENAKYVKPAGGISKADLASDVQASLELAQDVVYDISAHNNNTAYADLAAALGTDGANIPQGLRKGGMSIKYVQTYDNNSVYVQYRLMADAFTTNVAQWQGVDEAPVAGSVNLVQGKSIKAIEEDIYSKIDAPKDEVFTSASASPINKYFYAGIKYYLMNNGDNNMSVTPVFEDGTTGSATTINSSGQQQTVIFTVPRTAVRLNTYVANQGAVNLTVKTSNDNQLYEKIAALQTESASLGGRINNIEKFDEAFESEVDSIIKEPVEETFTSSVINKRMFAGVKYVITNDCANNVGFTAYYEDGTHDSQTTYIGTGANKTYEYRPSKTVVKLQLWTQSGVYDIKIKTTNDNQLYEKVETLREDLTALANAPVDAVPTKESDKKMSSDGIYVAASKLNGFRYFTDDDVVDSKSINGSGAIVTAGVRFRLAKFYVGESSNIRIVKRAGSNFVMAKYASSAYSDNGTLVSVTQDKDSVVSLDAGYYAVSWYSASTDATLIANEYVLYNYKNTGNSVVRDNSMPVSNAVYNAINALNGFKMYEDADVVSSYALDGSGKIITAGNRYKLAKFYLAADANVRIVRKSGSNLAMSKFTSGDYSATGVEKITVSQGKDSIVSLTAGYYAISWYGASTSIVHDEYVVYNYKNVVDNIGQDNNIPSNAAVYDMYNETVGDVTAIERSGSSAIGSWSLTKSFKAGKYLVENLVGVNTSVIFYDASNNELFRNSGFQGTIEAEISSTAVKVGGYTTATSVNVRIQPLYSHEKRIEAIESKTGTSILDYNSPYVYEPLIINNKYGRHDRSAGKHPCISLLQFSDIHGGTDNVERLMEFKERFEDYISDVICTGDIVTNRYGDTNILSGYEDMLLAIGNHDAWIDTDDPEMAERKEPSANVWVVNAPYTYNKFFADNIGNWGVVQPTDAAANGKCYYYKDYVEGSVKLRLIVLDAMHYGVGADLDGGVSIQNTWLDSVLDDAASNNLPVVIATHYWPQGEHADGKFVDLIDCNYTTTDSVATDYLPKMATDTVQDFIDGGGDFVCWITGHCHCDVIGRPRNYPAQMFIAIDTAKNSNTVGNSTVGGKGRDCFSIIAFDTNDKLVKVVRVGRDTTTQLKMKRRLVYRYAAFTDTLGTHNVGVETCE